MPVTIGAKRESDFSDPLGMLSDCHRRIERFLHALIVVAGQARGGVLPQNSELRWTGACVISARLAQAHRRRGAEPVSTSPAG